MTRALAAAAVLALGLFAAAAQAGEELDDSSFLKAASPLESGSLLEARSGVGVESSDEERRRRLGEGPAGGLSGTAAPLTGTRILPATRSASRATDFQASPALLTAIRTELQGLGLK